MINCCCQAVDWLQQQADRLGFDPQRILLAGSSAGAHLCSSVLLAARQEQLRLKPDTIAGALLLSGIYDLRPLVNTYINDPLQLDIVTAAALSPALQELRGLPPCVLCWGDNETSEFKRQSRQFSQLLQAAQVASECFEVVGRNHFDLVYELGLPNSQLGQALQRLGHSPQ
jgi:arylformamidase